MRVLEWHGWLLSGTGSNVYTARVTDRLRRAGHDVMLLCQDRHPERYPFVDAYGAVGPAGVGELTQTGIPPADGRVVLLRPDIGRLLPVFVVDEYEGFEVKPFVELSEGELERYLERNVAAFRSVLGAHEPDAIIVGHAVPGSVIGTRASGPGRIVAKIHGSDLEYAMRVQDRYRVLGREGLMGARAVVGPSRDVLRRAVDLVPEIDERVRLVAPGVETDLFRPLPANEALRRTADLLAGEAATARGRGTSADRALADALAARDAEAITRLALVYDPDVPDPSAAAAFRELAEGRRLGPIAGFFGKLIPQKGVHLFLQALALSPSTRGLVIGFGQHREWLHALLIALDRGDPDLCHWVSRAGGLELELTEGEIRRAEGLAGRIRFTGRLDHRFAPTALASLDSLVVPSVLDEAFGMVAAEGAAAGALPLLARHSGLGEVAAALEEAAGWPRLFSFEPGRGSARRIAEGLARHLHLSAADRQELRRALRDLVCREWTWERTTEHLLEAATGPGAKTG